MSPLDEATAAVATTTRWLQRTQAAIDALDGLGDSLRVPEMDRPHEVAEAARLLHRASHALWDAHQEACRKVQQAQMEQVAEHFADPARRGAA